MVQNFALANGESGAISMDALTRVVRADHRIQHVKEETPPPAGNGKITQIKRGARRESDHPLGIRGDHPGG
jgi:hypothetical protein